MKREGVRLRREIARHLLALQRGLQRDGFDLEMTIINEFPPDVILVRLASDHVYQITVEQVSPDD